MFGLERNVAAFVYFAGLFGFGLYGLLANADWGLVNAVQYGAQWPLLMFRMV